MKTHLIVAAALAALLHLSPAFAQQPQEISIMALERTDEVLRDHEPHLLQYNATQNRVVYHFDTVKQQYTTDQYLHETWMQQRDLDSIWVDTINTNWKKWSRSLPADGIRLLVAALQADIDTIPRNPMSLHQSHYDAWISVRVITGSDTTVYSKSHPFDEETPWLLLGEGIGTSIMNPAIDNALLAILPKQFLLRDKLKQ